MDLCCAQANQITAPSLQDSIKSFELQNNGGKGMVLHEGITILFEPPKKINISFYRCDNKFHFDNILDMYNNENLIGVCLLSGEELRIYSVSITGSHVEPRLVKRITICLPNKQTKGGQSAVRFARNADIVRNQYVIKYVENIVNAYMTENNTKCNVSKIVVAGFGYMPDDVIENALFKQYLNKYLYKKLVISSIDDLTVVKIIKDLHLVLSTDLATNVDTEIKSLIENNADMIGFGKNECINYIESKNITKLFVNKNLMTQDIRDIFMRCKNINIIESNSSQLELYGGWLCVKKYSTNYSN